MACRLVGAKPLSEPMLEYWSLRNKLKWNLNWNWRKYIWKCRLGNVDHFSRPQCVNFVWHYSDVIMTTTASPIASLTIVYSTVYSGADQSKHQSSASLAFVWGIHRGPVNSPHKRPVTRKHGSGGAMTPIAKVLHYFLMEYYCLNTGRFNAQMTLLISHHG